MFTIHFAFITTSRLKSNIPVKSLFDKRERNIQAWEYYWGERSKVFISLTNKNEIVIYNWISTQMKEIRLMFKISLAIERTHILVSTEWIGNAIWIKILWNSGLMARERHVHILRFIICGLLHQSTMSKYNVKRAFVRFYQLHASFIPAGPLFDITFNVSRRLLWRHKRHKVYRFVCGF